MFCLMKLIFKFQYCKIYLTLNNIFLYNRRNGEVLASVGKNCPRDHAAALENLKDAYFRGPNEPRSDHSGYVGPKYSENDFERRYRMPRVVFDRIYTATVNFSDFLKAGLRRDCRGKQGIHPLFKVTAALRMLSYAVPAEMLEDSLQIGESTALESLKQFFLAVIHCFKKEYLRKPTSIDIINIESQFSNVGFPGCIGCVDCSKWDWKACPKA